VPGKHVFSAVSAAITVEEMGELVETVTATHLTYMLAETSYYHPAAIHCRRRFARGDFGDFVYAGGEYLHDMSHSGSPPTVGVWDAARYCVPGMVGHESALRGGAALPVPDFGGPPAG